MDLLPRKFKERCKQEFGYLGFKSFRNCFYRVIGDVFQSFELCRSISGYQCTVNFVIAPLCVGNTIKKSYCGPDHLKMFENDYSWYLYDKYHEEHLNDCVDEMIEHMKKYLIPYFESAYNCKEAYYAVYDFQRKHYKNGIRCADYFLFYMALKAGLLDKSVDHLRSIRVQVECAYNRNKECYADKLSAKYEKRILDDIKRIDYQLERLINQDTEYIEKTIKENERKTLLNLGI